MKLHVGCGEKFIDGYKHQDICKYNHIDYLMPSWENPENDKTFEKIYSRNFVEHLYPHEFNRTLKTWSRILKNDGEIELILPDIEFHAKQIFLKDKSEFVSCSNFQHAIAGFYGWIEEGKEYMAHKFVYTKETISVVLKRFFTDVHFIESRKCDIHVVAKYPIRLKNER